jgi:hypothetical protein
MRNVSIGNNPETLILALRDILTSADFFAPNAQGDQLRNEVH